MDSPIHLLKTSSREVDSELRTKKIIRACKLLTDTFPFEQKRETLAAEPELVKFLILDWVFVRNSIEIIIETLFSKFKENKRFLAMVWANFMDIACISEDNDLSSAQGSPSDPQIYMTYLECEFSVTSKLDFNPEIQQSLSEIKVKTLEYSLQIFEHLSKLEYALPRTFFHQALELYKLFLINTIDDRVLLRTCECVEAFKKKYLFFFKNVCKYDVQIEEILMNKKRRLKNAKASQVFLAPVPMQGSPGLSPLIPLDFSLDLGHPGILLRPVKNEGENGKTTEKSQNEENQEGEIVDPLGKEKKVRKQFIDELDRWLCFDETNLISLNENMAIALKLTENLEIFVSFILNPFKFAVEGYWAERYECISERRISFDYKCFKLMNPIEEKEWSSKNVGQKTFYYLRAYKAATILSSKRNLKYLMTVNEMSFETIYEKLEIALKSTEINKFNLFHIGKMLNSFLIIEPRCSIGLILQYKFLALLSNYLYNPLLFDIFLNLISPNASRFHIDEAQQKEIWTNCYKTDILQDLSRLMLRGTDPDSKTTSKIDLKYYAFPIKYEKNVKNPISPEEIAKVELDKILGENSFLKANESLIQPEYLSKEELLGLKPDIDGLKTFMKQRRAYKGQVPLSQQDSLQRSLSRSLSRTNSSISRKKDYPDFDEFEEFDLKRNSPLLKKRKELTKGQKLIQKLRFVMKMRKKTEFFQRIMQGSPAEPVKEIPGQKSGYSTGSLIRVYPDIRLLDNYGEMERLSRMKGFSSESIVDAERVSLSISELFYQVLRDSLDYEEKRRWTELLDLERRDQGFLIELLCDHDCAIIQRMFGNYLVKIKALAKMQGLGNSAYEAGKFVNLLLAKMKTHSVLKRNHVRVHKLCLENFAFLSKLLIDMEHVKKAPMVLQGLTVENPLGMTKLLLMETFSLIIANDEDNKYAILEEINETAWHILCLWFFGNRINDNYHHRFYQTLRTALVFGSEKSLVKILFKVNLLASLYNSYEGILKNGVALNITHIESYLFYLKKIVLDINDVLQNKPGFSVVKRQIEASQSWKMLHLLLVENFKYGILEKCFGNRQNNPLPPLKNPAKSRKTRDSSSFKENSTDLRSLDSSKRNTSLQKLLQTPEKPILMPPLARKNPGNISFQNHAKPQNTTNLPQTRPRIAKSLHLQTGRLPVKATFKALNL